MSTSNLAAAHTVGIPIVNNHPTARVAHPHRTSGYGFPISSSLARVTHGEGAVGGTDTGIVYKSVDFIKTEAFMRTRQEAEKDRDMKKQTKG